jgi:hypothetical protein
MVVISKPDTHLYNFFPPWCVLAAIGLKNLHDLKISKLKNWLSIKAYHFIIGSCFFLFMLWCSFYIHTVFIKHNPEYLWKLSAHELPRHGFFGFPYHRSWKTVGYLFRTKILEGTYTGNEKQRISNFYLKQKKTPKRYKEKCKYFILCQNPQSWKEVSPPITFVPSIQILSSGKPTITIYEDAKNVSETKTYRSEDYEKLYDELDKKSEHP